MVSWLMKNDCCTWSYCAGWSWSSRLGSFFLSRSHKFFFSLSLSPVAAALLYCLYEEVIGWRRCVRATPCEHMAEITAHVASGGSAWPFNPSWRPRLLYIFLFSPPFLFLLPASQHAHARKHILIRRAMRHSMSISQSQYKWDKQEALRNQYYLYLGYFISTIGIQTNELHHPSTLESQTVKFF